MSQFRIVLPLKLEWNTSLAFILFHSNMETAKELCFILAFLKTQPLNVEKSKKHCLTAVSSKLQFMKVQPLKKQEWRAFPLKENSSNSSPSKQRSLITFFSFIYFLASSEAASESRLCLRHRSEPLKMKFEQSGMQQRLKENILHYISENFFLIDMVEDVG